MHGMIMKEEQQVNHASDYTPASFPLGRAWFAAFVELASMIWKEANEDRPAGFAMERAIADLGFETFAPAQEKFGIQRGRKVKVITPVFGPYLFVKFDREKDDWGNLRAFDYRYGGGIKGFIDILKNQNIPMRVPDLIIEHLKQAVDLGVFGLSPLTIGTQVEITEGRFAGFIGKIKSASKKRRVRVLLNMLATVDIDPCFLRKM